MKGHEEIDKKNKRRGVHNAEADASI